MRTRNSIINSAVSLITSVLTIILGFISQKIFVNYLGTEYLGLNGLFTNIISILAVAELGFGTAIVYNLYKPLKENNEKKINELIYFYKKIYRIVALIIFLIGIITAFFIPNIVGDTKIKNLRLLFLLYLGDVIFSYLLTYKRSILYADQKNYIVNIIHILCYFMLNVIQILILYFTGSYIIYLILKIFFRILENLVINSYVDKKYEYLNLKKSTLDKETKNDIIQKVKGLLYHNIGSALVLGTDNILISKMFGIVTVGLYSNYNIITKAINNLLNQLFQSLTSIVGNLLIENNPKKSYEIYKKMYFINSYIYVVASCCILCTINIFIELWMGNDFLLDELCVLFIVISFYVTGLKKTNSTFKNAAGIFFEDRYVPIFESVLNIIFSIILGLIFGLSGIFMGTIISSMVLYLYSYPKFIYIHIFKKNYLTYIFDNIKYIMINLFSVLIAIIIVNKINISNLLLLFVVKNIVIVIIISLIYYAFFNDKEEFKYYKEILKRKKYK